MLVAGANRRFAPLAGLLPAAVAIAAGTAATAATTAPPSPAGPVFVVARSLATRRIRAAGCIAGWRKQVGLDWLLLGACARPRFELVVVPSRGPRFTFRGIAGTVVELAVAGLTGHGATLLTGRRPLAVAPAPAAAATPAAPPSAAALSAVFAAVFAAVSGTGLTAVLFTPLAILGPRGPDSRLVAGRRFVAVAVHPRGTISGVAILPGRRSGGPRGGPRRFRSGSADAEIRSEGVPVATGCRGRAGFGL